MNTGGHEWSSRANAFVIPSEVEESLIFQKGMAKSERSFDCAAPRFAPLKMTSDE